jgi:hypothetical protein
MFVDQSAEVVGGSDPGRRQEQRVAQRDRARRDLAIGQHQRIQSRALRPTRVGVVQESEHGTADTSEAGPTLVRRRPSPASSGRCA